MVGDPIGDMITRIKNAVMAGKVSVVVPFSKIKFEIANVLKDEGYLSSVEIIGKEKLPYLRKLELNFAYVSNGFAEVSEKKVAKIKDVKRISKPSRRMYTSARDLPSKRQGGASILSTTGGIMTSKMAKEKGLGGELLFRIW